MSKLPIIHNTEEQDFGHYRLERLDLEFSNGERRRYERLKSRGHGAVMIAAIPQPDTILLIREYAAGKHRYEIGLPKGRMDAGESILDAANRELALRRKHTLRPAPCHPRRDLLVWRNGHAGPAGDDVPSEIEVAAEAFR